MTPTSTPVSTQTPRTQQDSHSGVRGWLFATARWALILLSAFAIGPLAASLLMGVRDIDGGRATSMFVSGNLLAGILGYIAVLGAGLLVGLIAAKVFSTTVAFACSGLILGWGAWRTGTLDEMIRRSRSNDELVILAFENGLVVLCVAAVAAIIYKVGRRHTGHIDPHAGLTSHLGRMDRRDPVMPMLLASFIASAVAAGITGYVAAATMSKGQSVFAAFVASIASGVTAQLVSRSKFGTVSPALPILAVLLPAMLAPIAAKVIHADKIVVATFAGQVFPLARIMSLDWACGLLLGVPVGMGWAGAMLDEATASER